MKNKKPSLKDKKKYKINIGGKMKGLNIKGQRYKIYFQDLKNLSLKEGTTLVGLCDKDKKRIFVESSLSEMDKKKTLLHEIIHAIINETAIDQIISIDAEEMLCENISQVIYNCFFKVKNGK